jgi:hypothetical protein
VRFWSGGTALVRVALVVEWTVRIRNAQSESELSSVFVCATYGAISAHELYMSFVFRLDSLI